VNEEVKYQRIYEEELSDNLKDSLEMPDRFYDLSHQQRMFITELVDIGFRSAVEESLDPAVLEETAALAGEMGSQLYNFANMLSHYLNADNEEDKA
jgi:hypothetical protein|tara:strand:- start:211 stop:498 length:288 start_codon:yes stop_codon:yes gene_type:complete